MNILWYLAVGIPAVIALVPCRVGAVEGYTGITATIPLTLHSVAVSDAPSSGAIVSWVTNGESTSQVFYGIASHSELAGYTFRSALDTSLKYAHAVTLSGLAPAQKYHYRVQSTIDSLTVMSADAEFTTPAAGGTPGGGFGGGGSGGGGGGSWGGVLTGPGVTNLNPFINDQGIFNIAAVAISADGNVLLDLPKGIWAVTTDQSPLRSVMIIGAIDVPPSPTGRQIVGTAYELTPDGATVKPSVKLSIAYDPADLQAGVDEARIYIAAWSKPDDIWMELPSTVDIEGNTVSALISHLTTYAVMARIGPAEFAIGDLAISPLELSPGEKASVSVTVRNTGDLWGTCQLVLRVNGIKEDTRKIELVGGSQELVSFSIVRAVPGKYDVDINGQTGVFELTARDSLLAGFTVSRLNALPVQTATGAGVTVSVRVSNPADATQTLPVALAIDGIEVSTATVTLMGGSSQTVEFQLVGLTSGDHIVSVGSESATLSVGAIDTELYGGATNWRGTLLAVVAGAAILLVSVFLKSRKKQRPDAL